METVEVLVRIPKQDFGFIKDEFADGNMPDEKDLKETTYYAIANGTVLPKGHGRLGDLDGIIKRHCFVECKGTPDCQSECEFFDRINDAPTVIEADKEEENG